MKQTALNNKLLKAVKPYATPRQYRYLTVLANSGATIEALEDACARNFPLAWDYMLVGTNYATITTTPYTPAPVYDQPALPTDADVEAVLEQEFPTVISPDGMGQHRNKGKLAAFFATLNLVEVYATNENR